MYDVSFYCNPQQSLNTFIFIITFVYFLEYCSMPDPDLSTEELFAKQSSQPSSRGVTLLEDLIDILIIHLMLV